MPTSSNGNASCKYYKQSSITQLHGSIIDNFELKVGHKDTETAILLQISLELT